VLFQPKSLRKEFEQKNFQKKNFILSFNSTIENVPSDFSPFQSKIVAGIKPLTLE
jgi:hypothetical protein